MNTSGETDPVWVHRMPYTKYPVFPTLTHNLTTEICIIGSGIAGISTAYELVRRGQKVTMLEARHVLSGETGRTSGHLSSALDDGYVEIQRKHGLEGAQIAAESHSWAISRVGEIAHALGIDCEFRRVPAYCISQYTRDDQRNEHEQEVRNMPEEVETAINVGLKGDFRDGLAVRGWSGRLDQRDGAIYYDQATFHPTRYLLGVLAWLEKQPNFQCFAQTRMVDIHEKDLAQVHTERGHVVTACNVVEATCVPLQKLSIVAEMTCSRTYCVAARVPRNTVEDCLIYDQAEPYKYARLTACDVQDDFIVVGGCDHKVGHEDPNGRFEELETWVRHRFPQATTVDYRWSGQVFEPVDYMAFIGKDGGQNHTYVVTGDSGDGLTNGVLAGRILADEMEGEDDPWAQLYNPSRLGNISRSLPSILKHSVQANSHYRRYLQSDIKDIEDLAADAGGVLHENLASTPVAVYKDGSGHTYRYSAICPHMKGVLCWNQTEKSWDCPVHGSRFSGEEGICVEGPAKSNLTPMDSASKRQQTVT